MNWHDVFVVGSLGFWLLLIGETILLILLVEWEQGAGATVSLIVTILLLQLLGDVNILGYVIEQPWLIVGGAVAYFVAGTFWSIAKWWFYVHEQRSTYDELRAAFLRVHGLEPLSVMPDELQHEWHNCLALANQRSRRLDVRPLVAAHKRDILRWMSYWPSSFLWTMLKDPVRKAFLTIYHNLAEYLQEISDQAFKGVQADLPPEETIPDALSRDPVLAEFGIDFDHLQTHAPNRQQYRFEELPDHGCEH